MLDEILHLKIRFDPDIIIVSLTKETASVIIRTYESLSRYIMTRGYFWANIWSYSKLIAVFPSVIIFGVIAKDIFLPLVLC